MHKIKITKNKNISALAYMSYVFQTFFKRPFGYIMAILYIVYLSVILLIVPKCNGMGPLAIWTIGGFNIPIFNLLFISASASTLAVSIFRTSREDGSDLVFSSKPLTKNQTAWIKTIAYLTIMLGLTILSLFITLLILPIYGKYNIISNVTGITSKEYTGIILSVFVGNIVNMLFFGGIAVLISLFGGQVITIIITIGSALLLLILNFLYPISVSSPLNVLSEQYNTSINSYSLYTLDQFNKSNTSAKSFAAIQCTTNDLGVENPNYHFDTYKYWNIAKAKAHSDSVNYIDFGKQLSSIYTAFGLDNAALSEASKLSIGLNSAYKYNILENTHVADHVIDYKYPISCYSLTQDRGKTFPKLTMLGGNMSLVGDNWYLWSTLNQINFNSINYLSNSKYSDHPEGISEDIWQATNKKPWMKMSDLVLSLDQQNQILNFILPNTINHIKTDDKDEWSNALVHSIIEDESQLFYKGEYNNLTIAQQYEIVSKIHLYMAILCQQWQKQTIENYCNTQQIDDQFPFVSSTINSWLLSLTDETSFTKTDQKIIEYVFTNGFVINLNQERKMFDRLLWCQMQYAETFKNLYEYDVAPFYSIWALTAAWSTIAVIMFTISIIVYRKIDFK